MSPAWTLSSATAGETDHVDAEVIVEAPVLDGDEGRGHEFGQFVQRDRFAAGFAAIGDKLAVAGDDADIGRAFGDRPGGHRGHLHPVVIDDTAGGDTADHAQRYAPVDELAEKTPDAEGLALALAAGRFLRLWRGCAAAGARGGFFVIAIVGKTGLDTLALGGPACLGLGDGLRAAAGTGRGATDPVVRGNLEIHEQSPGILLAHSHRQTPHGGLGARKTKRGAALRPARTPSFLRLNVAGLCGLKGVG